MKCKCGKNVRIDNIIKLNDTFLVVCPHCKSFIQETEFKEYELEYTYWSKNEKGM